MTNDIDFLIPGGGGGGGGGGAPSGPAGGDLAGTYPNPSVGGAHFGGADGNFFVRRAGLWVPGTIAAGDLPGTVAQTGQANSFGAFVQTAAAFAANLTGTAGRFVGQSSSPPATGTYLTGDFVADPTNGTFYVCTAGGTPGNWAAPSSFQLTNGAQSLVLEGDGTIKSTAGAATLGAVQTGISTQFISGNNVRGYVRVTVGGSLIAANAVLAIINFSAQLAFQAYIIVAALRTTTAQFGDSTAAATLPVGSYYAQFSQAANTAPASWSLLCNGSIAAGANVAIVYQVML